MHTRVGITRRVFITSRWAIKVPRLTNWGGGNKARGSMWSLTRGIQANLSELEWSGVEGANPVVRSWLGGIVNVYRRAHPVTLGHLNGQGLLDNVTITTVLGEMSQDEPLGYCKAIEDTMRWEQLTVVAMPGDRKLANLGVVRGRVVWIDYDQSWNGCPHHPGEMCRPFE